jgi:hypothetical protein
MTRDPDEIRARMAAMGDIDMPLRSRRRPGRVPLGWKIGAALGPIILASYTVIFHDDIRVVVPILSSLTIWLLAAATVGAAAHVAYCALTDRRLRLSMVMIVLIGGGVAAVSAAVAILNS